MKKKGLFFGMLAIVLALGLVGCATSSGGKSGDDGIPKRLIITGFNPQLEGTRRFSVNLTGDWSDEQNTWIIPAGGSISAGNGYTQLDIDAKKLTFELWHDDKVWTGTGEYGVNFDIFPSTEHGTVKTYRYRHNMPGVRTVNIKERDTIVEWSSFVFGWDWED
jgi:hypothetical protein